MFDMQVRIREVCLNINYVGDMVMYRIPKIHQLVKLLEIPHHNILVLYYVGSFIFFMALKTLGT